MLAERRPAWLFEMFLHTLKSVEPQNLNLSLHATALWCVRTCLCYEESSCACAWPDDLKTDPCYFCQTSDPLRLLRFRGAQKNAIQPLLHGRPQFPLSLLESHHCAMEGNGFRCTLELFGYEAAPEVCLLGADGQLLQPPASGAGRIEYFLLGDV